jgi:serine O-acetyltransferase
MLRELFSKMVEDLHCVARNDPAARSKLETLLCHTALHAIFIYRIAHLLHARLRVPLLPRMLSTFARLMTGVEIHPGATIGRRFFIDHGTGVVIGETTEIGDRVKLYQGVTLGALSVDRDMRGQKRHPTIEDDVTIYAGATILGGETVIGRRSVIGGNVWLVNSVPPYSRVYNARSSSEPIVTQHA